jgi:hypothetical protein
MLVIFIFCCNPPVLRCWFLSFKLRVEGEVTISIFLFCLWACWMFWLNRNNLTPCPCYN